MTGRVWETKIALDGRKVTFPCRALDLHVGEDAVLLFRTPRAWIVEAHAIRVPAGSYSFGYFWVDRNVNAYHWVRKDGTSLGVYFNVATDTRITATEVIWRDLALDYWVGADGLTVFLDEDEVPKDLPPDLDRIVRMTRDGLAVNGRALAVEIASRSADYWARLGLSAGR